MESIKLAHVNKITAKGRVYYYHRITGERLPDDPEKRALRVLEINAERPEPSVRAGTMAHLIYAYRSSPKFLKRAPRTKKDYARHLAFYEEHYGHTMVRACNLAQVEKIQAMGIATPRTTDYRIQVLSILLGYAQKRRDTFRLPKDWTNPCVDVEPLYQREEGYKPWPDNVIQFALEEAYPELRWAIAFGLCLGQRGQDDIRMLWSKYDGELIAVRQQKTGTELWIPVPDFLREIIKTIPRRAAVILTTRTGRPWTPNNLQHEISKLLATVGFYGYSRHGLRKNAVNELLEAGCTQDEVSSITGQTPQTIAHYARRVNKKLLARSAMAKRYPTIVEREGD